MEGKSAAPRAPSYHEFEPLCQWQREEGRDTLVIHLPEFKKEQLRVQVNNRGTIKISGERSVDTLKKSKFYKEVEVPKDCDANGIQAKFANSYLYVVMPKSHKAPTEQTKAPEVDGSGVDQKKPVAAQDPVGKAAPAEDKKNAGSSKEKMPPAPKDVTKPKSSVSRMKSCGKTSLNVALAVAVLAALVSYVFYMYRSIILED